MSTGSWEVRKYMESIETPLIDAIRESFYKAPPPGSFGVVSKRIYWDSIANRERNALAAWHGR